MSASADPARSGAPARVRRRQGGHAGSRLAVRRTPGLLLAALLAALLPVLLTPVLPVKDGYLHAVRYLVLSGVPLPTGIEASYEADWRLLPNLGVDLIGAGLMRVLEPLPAMKAVGALMILAPLGGVLALSAALHGRPTPVALLMGGVLAINHITLWGFTNFLVGLGLALGGVAMWIALARRPRAQLGAALLFAPVLLLVHGLSFALWGLLLGSVELAAAWQERRRGGLRPLALGRRMARLLLLAVAPVLLWTQMPTGDAAALTGFLHHATVGEPVADRIAFEVLQRSAVALLVGETGWRWFDFALGTVFWCVFAWGLLRGALHLHPLMVVAAAGALGAVALTPSFLLGVAYIADRAPLLLGCVLAAACRMPAHAGGPGFEAAGGGGRAGPVRVLTLAMVLLLAADAALTALNWHRQGRHYAAFLADPRLQDVSGTAVLLRKDSFEPGAPPPRLICEPLAPLLTLSGLAATPTFDDPTQQPLRLMPGLKGPWDAFYAMDALPASGRTALDLGFDWVIACDASAPAAPRPDEGAPLARGLHWYVIGRP